MTSKQRSNNSMQYASSSSSKPIPRTLVFNNFDYQGDYKQLVKDLRKNYRGIEDAVSIYHNGSNGELIYGIRIVVKSDDFANQFLQNKQIRIDDFEYSIKSPSVKSIIVKKVPSGEQLRNILQDLSHNYLGSVEVSRFYELNGTATDIIRVDFKSDATATKVLKDNYILIDGKRRVIEPYWSLGHLPNENETEMVPTSEQTQSPAPKQIQSPAPKQIQNSAPKQIERPVTRQPQTYLTERRVKELFQEQQIQLEAMINEFENKWNARLSPLLSTTSTNTNADQLIPIMKDLSTVAQQFKEQNAQLQRQIGSIVNQIQDVQFKSAHEQTQEAWPRLPTQNGN